MHLAHVLHEHGGAVHDLDRDVVQFVDRGGRGIGAHDILLFADLGGARGQGEVLGVDRVHHVDRRQALGDQLGGIDVDHDLAVFAARRRRQSDAGDRRELLAHAVDAVVVELLLVQRVGAKADLQHRHARGVELHDDGRLDAGRHQGADGVGRRHDLGDREVEIDVGLEVDLLHREARQGLRLDVLDAVDVGRDGVLAVGGDALLHLGRAEPGVAPDHRHHRDADLGEDVGAHGPGGDAAQEDDQRRRHVERVGETQCETDKAHGRIRALSAALSHPYMRCARSIPRYEKTAGSSCPTSKDHQPCCNPLQPRSDLPSSCLCLRPSSRSRSSWSTP